MRKITKSISVNAPISTIYKMWTTKEGAESFFGVKSIVDFKIGGAFEILFDSSQKDGLKGSEGCVYLDFRENEFVSFSWNVPPVFEKERAEEYRSIVTVNLKKLNDTITIVELENEYLQPSDQLDNIIAYFDRAWGMVLSNLKSVLEEND